MNTTPDSEKRTPDSENASARACEAWDSLPGDEIAVFGQELTTDPAELSVEIIVRTPDGTVMKYKERIEVQSDDYTLDEAHELLEMAHRIMTARLDPQQ